MVVKTKTYKTRLNPFARFMKIRSAVPENGCLVFCVGKKTGKNKKQKQTSVKHIRIRLIGGCASDSSYMLDYVACYKFSYVCM